MNFLRLIYTDNSVERMISLCRIIIRIIRYEGMRSLYERTKSFIYHINREMTKSFKREPIPIRKSIIERGNNRRVSVIIPTKNAGLEFEKTIVNIQKQRGYLDIEIIVIDSGSQDDTPKLAEKYSSKVYRILPEQFNHGLTRNLGAEKASGEYIVFIVQDAIPLNNDWLKSMVNVLDHDPNIGAVTCKQFVREDADLFARFMNHYQYVSLELRSDEVRYVGNSSEYCVLSPGDKRRISQLDNVCTCFRKEFFQRYQFKEVKYAEDLEIGARIAMDGHKLAFLNSNGVIHSHNRSSVHFLKRSYMDQRLAPKFLVYDPPDPILPKGLTIQDILFNMNELYFQVGKNIREMNLSRNIRNSFFYSPLFMPKVKRGDSDGKRYVDEEMDNFLEEFQHTAGWNGRVIVRKDSNIFIDGYVLNLKRFIRYVSHYPIGEENRAELERGLLKLLGYWFGNYLGEIMTAAEIKRNELIYRENIDRFLSAGL